MVAVNPYPQIGREEFLNKVREHFDAKDLEQIEAAYVFAKYGHKGQFRDSSDVRYFEHPKAVAWIIISELGIFDLGLILLALLHDLIEDTFLLSDQRILLNFGTKILDGLKVLSKNRSADYHGGLMQAEWRVLLVKICDRLHNMRTLSSCSLEKQIRQRAETITDYLPLCDRLVEIIPECYVEQARYLKKGLEASVS